MTKTDRIKKSSMAPYIFSLLLLSIHGCDGGRKPGAGPGPRASELIDTLGSHQVDSWTITTSFEKGTSVVEFKAESLEDPSVQFSGTVGNDFGRWFLHWDSNRENLWVYGEAGTFVWTENENEEYERQILRPNSTDLIQRMPCAVFDALPSTLKEQWRSIR